VNLDREDASRWCARNAMSLFALRKAGTPPGVAAAEFCKSSAHINHEAWKAEHQPEIPAPAENPDDLADPIPF
jgi:hypothetical protein